jgi:hypothetical protein
MQSQVPGLMFYALHPNLDHHPRWPLLLFQMSYTTLHSGHHTTVSASVDKVSDSCPSTNINQALGETVLHPSLLIEHQASTRRFLCNDPCYAEEQKQCHSYKSMIRDIMT